MKVRVRNGYVFFKGAHAYPGGSEIDGVTDDEYGAQSWKLESVPVVEEKMVTEKTILNRSMRGAEHK